MANQPTIEFRFQSRCRDWVVGEKKLTFVMAAVIVVSVSLPRLGGWRGGKLILFAGEISRFSLVAEIGWLASEA